MIDSKAETPQEAARHIGEIARSLAQMAQDANLPVLAYLFDMVILHCAELALVHAENNGRKIRPTAS